MAPVTIAKDTLQEIIDRLERGAALIAESRALGFSHNGPLRTALRELLGAERYSELLHGKHRPTRGAVARRTGESAGPRPDDSGVPIVATMRKSDGWSWRIEHEHEPIPRRIVIKDEGEFFMPDRGRRITVVRSPDGVEYVEAFDSEPADLLRTNPANAEAEPLRFVRWERSQWKARIDKRLAKAEKEQAVVEAHVEKKKAEKKKAKKAKKQEAQS